MLLAVALVVGVVGAAPIADAPRSTLRPASVDVLQLAQAPPGGTDNFIVRAPKAQEDWRRAAWSGSAWWGRAVRLRFRRGMPDAVRVSSSRIS